MFCQQIYKHVRHTVRKTKPTKDSKQNKHWRGKGHIHGQGDHSRHLEPATPAPGPDSSLSWTCEALASWGRTPPELQGEKPRCVLKPKPSFDLNSKHDLGVTLKENRLVAGPTFLEDSPGVCWSPAPHTELTAAIQLSWELPPPTPTFDSRS